jgi:DNA polymerase II large subunit
MKEYSEAMDRYFSDIDDEVSNCYKVAEKARKKGMDPEKHVDIPLAKNMAERVDGLIFSVTDKLKGTGMVKRIFELEKKYGSLDWRVALKIAEEVAKGKFCKFDDVKEAMEIGIRVGFAYNTVGVVAAPLEGFMELKIKKRNDGGEYVSPWYSGPIRGAGGTAASFSVMLTDYVRKKMGLKAYDPTEEEIKRFCTEIRDYNERVTNLQYFPSEEEIEFLVRHIPVEINGSPTEKFDVSNYKDLSRVETNKIRGGICLVLAEGVAQKAKKLWKRVQKWGKEFDLDWFFLEDFLKLQDRIKAKGKKNSSGNDKLSPNYTFIADLVAGRPILTMPMAPGGFRLRYGRTRTTGFSASALNPVTMEILNRFIAIGTQLKVERPGKAASMTVCDSLDGPVVRLKNGNVLKLRTIEEARANLSSIEKNVT